KPTRRPQALTSKPRGHAGRRPRPSRDRAPLRANGTRPVAMPSMLLRSIPTRGQTGMIRAREPGSDPAGIKRQSMLDGDLLDIYLSDHFYGATAGLNLAKRMSGASPAGPLSEIAAEIESDRQTLRGVMTALHLRPSLLKTVTGWCGDRAGRVTAN